MRTRTEQFALAGMLFLAALLGTERASANGRFPAAGHISVDPANEAHVAVRTTYGLLVTSDSGENWDWICEQAVKWTGQYDPSITITEDGTIIAGIYDHLSVGGGDHCGWSSALDQKNVVDGAGFIRAGYRARLSGRWIAGRRGRGSIFLARTWIKRPTSLQSIRWTIRSFM